MNSFKKYGIYSDGYFVWIIMEVNDNFISGYQFGVHFFELYDPEISNEMINHILSYEELIYNSFKRNLKQYPSRLKDLAYIGQLNDIAKNKLKNM